MDAVTQTLSAFAASVAALLAGANLYFTGRRDRTKWAREAMVGALAEFLDASFRCKDACKRAITLRESAASGALVEEQLAMARGVHDEMLELLTRLRLLAPPRVVEAADVLRMTNKNYVSVLSSGGITTATKEGTSDQRREIAKARERFLRAAKHALKIH